MCHGFDISATTFGGSSSRGTNDAPAEIVFFSIATTIEKFGSEDGRYSKAGRYIIIILFVFII